MSSDSYRYTDATVVMQDLDYVVFDVKACSSAKIALEHIPGIVTRSFEVVIGISETKGVAIRDDVDGDNKLEAQTDTILLDCDIYKTFWIHWNEDRKYLVGRGSSVMSDTIIDYSPVNFRIANAVAFDTSNSVDGDWVVKEVGRKYWVAYISLDNYIKKETKTALTITKLPP